VNPALARLALRVRSSQDSLGNDSIGEKLRIRVQPLPNQVQASLIGVECMTVSRARFVRLKAHYARTICFFLVKKE
jgi:hypothetical protein